MQGQNSGIPSSLVTIHRAKIVQRITEASAVEVDTREVQFLKYCISINPRILTKDLHPNPRPQADAIFDLL